MERFSAKILVFGEYTVLKGSAALAIPWNAFSGSWAAGDDSQDALMSNKKLVEFADGLGRQSELCTYLDIEQFQREIEMGLWFCSNIPTGGGLGSSGALTAAVAYRFGKGLPENLNFLRTILGRMESHFHRLSSGVDPLTAYLQHPVMVSAEKTTRVTFPFADYGCPWQIFLIPTGQEKFTYSSVKEFVTIENDDNLLRMKELNNQLVDIVLFNNMNAFEDILRELSVLQMSFFAPLIGGYGLEMMAEGLKSKRYTLKLCGSGGGYLLGFTRFPDSLPEYFSRFRMIAL